MRTRADTHFAYMCIYRFSSKCLTTLRFCFGEIQATGGLMPRILHKGFFVLKAWLRNYCAAVFLVEVITATAFEPFPFSLICDSLEAFE